LSFPPSSSFPYLGHGVGLRVPHYERALAGALEVDWVEVISENFFGSGGRPRAVLEAVRRERPLVFHGVSLGVGSLGAPHADYLRRLRALARDFEPAWISDHVCWTRLAGRESHELLPLPFTEEALAVAVDNTQRAQDALGRALVLENTSSYVQHAASQLTEWEFLAELALRSGCSLLLDLNNIIVSAFNHGFAPDDYTAGLPAGRVVQFHLANHSQYPHHKFDDHRGPVPEAVWALYEAALRRFGPVSSLVEWDEDIPVWERLVVERDEAARRAELVLGPAAPRSETPTSATGAGRPRRIPSVARARAAPGELGAPELEAAQRLFFGALTWPRGVGDWAATAPGVRAELERHFGAGDADPIERLELYANTYFYRQLDALKSVFPRLARLAGDAAFHDLVTDYVLECASHDPDLHHRGERLPAFVRAHALGRESPLLADVAELELALASALDAADAEPLGRAELARLLPGDWPHLELRLVPSARLVRAAFDLERVARLCDAGEVARALEVPRLAGTLEPAAPEVAAADTGTVLVFRPEHRVSFRSLEPLEAFALARLAEGIRFDALCEGLGAHGVTPAVILAWLERWLDDALLEDNRQGKQAVENIGR
jgi:uncharacterized protein (UPF0276 family)